MIELTMARTKELLAEAVAERGADYVYTNPDGLTPDASGGATCFYVHHYGPGGPLPEPQPGCIAGLVLHKAGVELEEFDVYEADHARSVTFRLERAGVLRAEPGVGELLREVQQRQDFGASWGEAVSRSLPVESSTED